MTTDSRFNADIIRTGPNRFLVTNRRTGAHSSMTGEERYLLEQLRMQRPRSNVLSAYARRYGRELPPDQCDAFVCLVKELGLLERADDGAAGAVSEPVAIRPAAQAGGDWLNPCFDVAVAALGWMVHPFMVIPVLGLFGLALLGLGHRWGEFIVELTELRGMPLLLFMGYILACALIFILLPRALLRGIACRKHRGRIYGFGARTVCGVFPIIYCDVGDSIGLMKRPAQWILVAVGSWTQVAVFSIAFLGWSAADPTGVPRTVLTFIAVPSGIMLILHAIIFIPRDGYFLLCFMLKQPRLKERALAETRAWLLNRVSPEPVSARERFWLRVFGVGSILTRVVGYALIIGGGGYLIGSRHGADGFIVWGAFVLAWIYPSVEGTVMSVIPASWRTRSGGSGGFTWGVRSVILAVVVLAGFLPYSYDVVGECRVLPAHQQGLRAQMGGEIVTVHVREGEQVTVGEPVVTLNDRDVRVAVDSMRAELARGRATLEMLRSGSRPEEIEIGQQRVELALLRMDYLQREHDRVFGLHEANAATEQQLALAEQESESARATHQVAVDTLSLLKAGARPEQLEAAEAEVLSLEVRLDFAERQEELLEVTSPIDGVVSTPHMSQRLGQVVNEGDLIAVVKDPSKLKVEIAAGETAAALVAIGMPVDVRLFSLEGRLLEGTVTDVFVAVETASRFLPEPVRSDREGFMQTAANRREEGRSRVRVYAAVDAEPNLLRPGMTGYARIAVRRDFFWRVLFRRISRFIRTEVWSWLP